MHDSQLIEVEGGCQCGAHRYAATVDPAKGYWCHCRMCQRATGSVAAAFVNTRKERVRWLTGPPATYMSSPIGRRGFCAHCGTPLTFDYPDSPNMDLTIGSLDAPGRVPLSSHFGIESRVPGWIAPDHLPAETTDADERLKARWARLKASEQEAGGQ
jgi:hypothetical protein